jgi:hypothetical protein
MIKVFKCLRVFAILNINLILLEANTIRLRVVSPQGIELKKVQVGMPCLVEVVLPGSVQLKQQLVIPGLDPHNIVRQQESSQLYVHNGVQRHEKTIGYMVTFSESGSFQLGPVRCDTMQGILTSQAVNLMVEPASEKKSEKLAAFAEWRLENNSAYVGQAVPFSLNFYYNDESITNVGPVPFKLPDFQLAVHEAGVGSIECRDGISYRVLMWRGVLYPKKTGKLVLPAVTFEYLEPQESMDQRSVWMQFMQMVGSTLTQKRLQSSQKVIEAKPLPAHSGPVAGVGAITQLEASISATQAEAGKPLVYTLTLAGDGDLESVDAPILQVPEAFKVYSSRVDKGGNGQIKKWEYIVQGLRAGSWTIPAQQLTFFNPQRERYETFSTKPMAVEISGEIRGENIDPELEVESEKEEFSEQGKNIAMPAPSTELGINSATSPHPSTPLRMSEGWELPLSWFWFFILMVTPIFIRLQRARLSNGWRAWHTYFKNYMLIKRVSKKIATLSAYEQLKQIQQLYEQVIRSNGVAPTDRSVLARLELCGISHEHLQAWVNSWDSLTAAAFSANNKPNVEAAKVIMNMLAMCVRRPSWRRN